MNQPGRHRAVLNGMYRPCMRLAYSPVVGLGAVILGSLAAYLAMRRQGVDAQFPYLYAYGVWGGHPIFDAAWRDTNMPILFGLRSEFGLFMPPALGILMLPLAALSYETARVVLLFLCVFALVAGVVALFALARPQVPWPARLTVAGLVLVTACARWCFTPVQLAPLLAALLVATLVGLHRDRSWMVYLATTIVFACKPTIFLPFALLLVLHRRYKILFLALATNVLLNGIAFSRLGGLEGIRDYRAGSATLEGRGTINTPNFWEHISIPRTDWTYLVTGVTGSFGLGRALALFAGAVAVLFLCLVCIRVAQPPSLADSCRIMLAGSLVGLLVVYHHHYDLAMLIPPLLLAAMLYRELKLSWSSWVVWSFAPLVFIMLFVPAAKATSTVGSIVGDRGPGLVNVTFPIATTLALFGSLAMVVQSAGSVADWKAWITAVQERLTRRTPSVSGQHL